MSITIQYGPGNSLVRSITNTNDIGSDVLDALGASSENTEFIVDGEPYQGPLAPGAVVVLRQKANEKG